MNESELLKHLYESGQSAFEYALQLSQRDEWQPIETVPKQKNYLTHHVFVLLSDNEGHMCAGCCNHYGDFIPDYDAVYGDDMSLQFEPTHWKPLSPPDHFVDNYKKVSQPLETNILIGSKE